MSTTINSTQSQTEYPSRLTLRAEPIRNVKELVLKDGKYLGRQVGGLALSCTRVCYCTIRLEPAEIIELRRQSISMGRELRPGL
jgi:hypothetical protein